MAHVEVVKAISLAIIAFGSFELEEEKLEKAGTVGFKNIPHGRWGRGPGSVDKRFPAGLPFPVPEILEFVAFRDSGKLFQQFSRDFQGVFAEKEARFRGKWASPPPPPHPRPRPPPPFSWGAVGVLLKIPGGGVFQQGGVPFSRLNPRTDPETATSRIF